MIVPPKSDVTDVTKLSDAELFSALKKLGVTVGPIQGLYRN
jgi:hypothetical protein